MSRVQHQVAHDFVLCVDQTQHHLRW